MQESKTTPMFLYILQNRKSATSKNGFEKQS